MRMKYCGVVCSKMSRIKWPPIPSEVKSLFILKSRPHPECVHLRVAGWKHKHGPVTCLWRKDGESSLVRGSSSKDSLCLGISGISFPSQIPGDKRTVENVFTSIYVWRCQISYATCRIFIMIQSQIQLCLVFYMQRALGLLSKGWGRSGSEKVHPPFLGTASQVETGGLGGKG